MDPLSSAAPNGVPPSPVPPLLPEKKQRRTLLVVGLVLAFVVGPSIGFLFLIRALERRQPGAAVLLQFDLSKEVTEKRDDLWKGIVKAVNRRAGTLGGCRVDEVRPDQIRIRFYGKKAADIAAAGPYLAKSMAIEFRLVHRFLTPKSTQAGETPLGYLAMTMEYKDRAGEIRTNEIFVRQTAEMTGETISEAYPVMDEHGRFKIMLRFTKEGGQRFAAVTRAIGEDNGRTGRLGQLAIVIDGKLYSAPVVREEIPSGSAEITGSFSQREALELAGILGSPLPLSASYTFENADGTQADPAAQLPDTQ
jgi:SecD/SecF fusion protein